MTLPIYSSLIYSPSWYSANVLDTMEWNHDDKSGIFYYGAKNSIYFFKVNEIVDDTKIINDQTTRNFYYDVKLCFFMKAHHDFIVGVYTLTNEVLLTFKNEKKLAKLISCGKDKMIRLWSFDEVIGCSCLKDFNISNTLLTTNVTCISVSDRNIAVCGFEKGFLLSWNYVTDEWKTFITESEDIITIVWNGDKLAIGHKRGLVSVFSMEKYDTLIKLTRFPAHHSDTCNICWNPYPDTVDLWGDLATAGKDCRVGLWRIDTNRNLTTLNLPKAGRKCIPDSKSVNKDSGSSWSSLCWSNIDNGSLIVSTAFGNLGIWKSPSATELKCFPHNSQIKIHAKAVFGINEWRNNSGLIVSHSLDRTINIARITDNGTMEGCVYSMPGIGGAVMSLSGVVHTNQLAIGCGDNNIRLWKYDSVQRRSYDVTNVWNGVMGRVMCVCWHPYREGLLAFGTEDGQVGYVNVTRDKKQATSSQMLHKGKVFVVTWGVDLRRGQDSVHDDTVEDSLIVYSVGNYALFGHDFRRDDFFDASDLVSDGSSGISDFCVHSSLRYVAVGYGNGSVKVFAMSPVRLICTIKSHSKGINCMRWSPLGAGDKLAIGSNERFLTVTDLSTVFEDFVRDMDASWCPLEVTETVASFKGHGDRITCVDWSPFDEDKLVTGSYDYTAFVWSVTGNGPVASFNCHQGKVLCCHWSRRDPDLIYTGGDDCNLLSWRLSEQSLPTKLNKRRQVHDIPGIGSGVAKKGTDESSVRETNKEKDRVDVETDGVYEEDLTKLAAIEKESVPEAVAKLTGKKTFVKKRNSLFPTTLFAVHHSLNDYLESMIKFVNDEPGYLPCFSMFSDRSTILAAIEQELDYHRGEGNYDNYFMILIWIGKIGRVIRECVSMNYSADWLMAVVFSWSSSAVPEELIQTMVGNIITDRKDPLLAATVLVSTNHTMKAIELLIGYQCVREALILAKLRLAPDHPLIKTDIMLQSQAYFYRNGSFELAAMCSLSLGNYRGFVETMHRRNSSLGNWVVVKAMVRLRQDSIADQCVASFVNGLLLQAADNDDGREAKQWLDRVRTEACLGPYSVLIDVHRALWTERIDLGSLVTMAKAACERYSGEKVLALQAQIRARLSAKQISQAESQISLHITYELFVIIVDCLNSCEDNSLTLSSLAESLRQLRLVNANELVLERLVSTPLCQDAIINKLRQEIEKLEI